MATEKISAKRQAQDGSVTRGLINLDISGQSVITRLIAGSGINITSSTGADSGTGEVTIESTVVMPVGSGNVIGPASAVADNFASFNGTTGKIIKDSGYAGGSFSLVSHDHDADYAPIAKGVTNGDSHDHVGGDGATIDHNTTSNLQGGTTNEYYHLTSAEHTQLTSGKRMLIFTVEGDLVVESAPFRFYNKTGITRTMTMVFLSVGTAPTGSGIWVDVNKNGTTIFTTQANRPYIDASAYTGQSTNLDITSLADGDYLTVDVDGIGTTIPGSDLAVHIIYS